MKKSIISIHKSKLIFWKKILSVFSMWKLTLGYGIGIKLGFCYLQSFQILLCSFHVHMDIWTCFCFYSFYYKHFSITTYHWILLVYLEVQLQSQIFFICARWPSVLENKISTLEEKMKISYRIVFGWALKPLPNVWGTWANSKVTLMNGTFLEGLSEGTLKVTAYLQVGKWIFCDEF
jgi:hypothetical protein